MLMRLPPRQSTAEADLMVPFQLVSLHSKTTTSHKSIDIFLYMLLRHGALTYILCLLAPRDTEFPFSHLQLKVICMHVLERECQDRVYSSWSLVLVLPT